MSILLLADSIKVELGFLFLKFIVLKRGMSESICNHLNLFLSKNPQASFM